MRDFDTGLTQARLKELLRYDPEAGLFTWLVDRGAAYKGMIVTYTHKGHVAVRLDAFLYKAHRLAWLYIHGVWPKNEIDHINRIPADNRLVNLREATSAENKRNHKIQTNNKSGVPGVTWCKRTKKWHAGLQHFGKHIHFGRHAKFEDAVAARKAGEAKYFGEFARAA